MHAYQLYCLALFVILHVNFVCATGTRLVVQSTRSMPKFLRLWLRPHADFSQ